MIDTIDRIGEQAEYDEAEVRRRLARVYRLLIGAARQKRLRDERSAAAQDASADTGGFV